MKVKFLITVFSLMLSGIVVGQTTTNRIDKRQQNQKERVIEGVKSGELTAKERKKLAKQQAKIRKLERRAKKDGVITPKEKARIKKAQDKASAMIKRKKNNNISR